MPAAQAMQNSFAFRNRHHVPIANGSTPFTTWVRVFSPRRFKTRERLCEAVSQVLPAAFVEVARCEKQKVEILLGGVGR
jgi:hypothetical protein